MSDATEVCDICDIAGCHHIRSRADVALAEMGAVRGNLTDQGFARRVDTELDALNYPESHPIRKEARARILAALEPAPTARDAARDVHAMIWAEGAAKGGLDNLSVEALALMNAADDFLSSLRAIAEGKDDVCE